MARKGAVFRTTPGVHGALLLALLAVAGCGGARSRAGSKPGSDGGAPSGGSSDAGGSSGAGATSGVSGSSTTGGSGGSSGVATTSGGSAGSAASGAGASAGGVSGGDAQGGSSAGTVTTMGGEGGEAASAGAGAGSAGAAGGAGVGAAPSPGCALGNAEPETELVHFERTQVLLPPGYDGVTPLPILIGFHETNVSNQFTPRTVEKHPLGQSYVVIAPQVIRSSLATFENDDVNKVNALLDEVLNTLCVDRRNLFAAGQGSGGRFLGKVLCQGRAISSTPGLGFRAVTIMGAYNGCFTWPAIPLLFVHGLSASESAQLANDADGQKALGRLRTNNDCDATSTPHPISACSRSGTPVTPSCVDFAGCSAALRYCAHDDPIQNNSGWPCFAYDQMYAFFETHRVP